MVAKRPLSDINIAHFLRKRQRRIMLNIWSCVTKYLKLCHFTQLVPICFRIIRKSPRNISTLLIVVSESWINWMYGQYQRSSFEMVNAANMFWNISRTPYGENTSILSALLMKAFKKLTLFIAVKQYACGRRVKRVKICIILSSECVTIHTMQHRSTSACLFVKSLWIW